MTPASRSPVQRLTDATYCGRAIVVGIHADFLTFREKGRRTVYKMDIGAAYWRAVKITAGLAKAERAANKKARRK